MFQTSVAPAASHSSFTNKYPIILPLETLFFSVNQNKPKCPSLPFFLQSTLPSPSYCLLFLNAFSSRFGFFVRLNPTNDGSCTQKSAILQLLPIWWNRERQRERILMDDSILTDNLHFSRTATNQPSNSLNTKNSTLLAVLTLLYPNVITKCKPTR